jgi:CubicO group peptidase (beta-lactamase class C family)
MAFKKTSSTALLFVLLFSLQVNSQPSTNTLPRSTPEAQGVSSKGISDFLAAVKESKHEFHSFMFLRHGKIIAEGWWNPYAPDLKHTLYSLSKSFTSTAVGFAVSEKKLTVNDKVISFFPDQLPDTVSTYLSELRVKDLLSMSVGQAPDPTGAVGSRDTNWVKGFLALPILNEPGTKFLYNSLATYMLSAIVQKVTGQKVVDYLTPRLFKPLGIQGMDWETDPKGINTGGWGLRVKTEDIARFAQLYLQKGKWNGKQILPAEWVEEATSMKIEQAPDAPQSKKDSSDWLQGYCYQFWRSRNHSYRGDGAFGQYALVFPEQDAIIAITSETADMQGELNLVFEHLLPAMQNDKLPADAGAAMNLKQKLASLKLPLPVKSDSSFITPALTGKTFAIQSNDKHIDKISFAEKGHTCLLTLQIDNTNYPISFGKDKWIKGTTSKFGPSLVAPIKHHFVGLPPSQVAGSYTWKNKNELEMQLRYIDSPHSETMVFHFDGDKVSVDYFQSFDYKLKKIVLEGQAN